MSYVCAYSSVQLDKSRVEKEFTIQVTSSSSSSSSMNTVYIRAFRKRQGESSESPDPVHPDSGSGSGWLAKFTTDLLVSSSRKCGKYLYRFWFKSSQRFMALTSSQDFHSVAAWPWPLTLWPWKSVQRLADKCRIFLASVIEIRPLSKEISRHTI